MRIFPAIFLLRPRGNSITDTETGQVNGMASQYPEYKRRPPPIEIPRAVPGPNAFAIAAKQDASDRRREDKPSQRQSPTRSSDNTPFPFPLRDGSGDATRLPPKSRSSAITTFASLMDQARGSSPRKSEHSSTVSRHGSTTRSRHSERSYLSAASRKGQLGGLGEENKTSRGELEAQSERKFFKMMGQIPQTPASKYSDSSSLVDADYSRSSISVSREARHNQRHERQEQRFGSKQVRAGGTNEQEPEEEIFRHELSNL